MDALDTADGIKKENIIYAQGYDDLEDKTDDAYYERR